MRALEAGELGRSAIVSSYTGDIQDMPARARRPRPDVLRTEVQTVKGKIINTTVGASSHQWRSRRGCRSSTGLKKKGLQQLVQSCYLKSAREDGFERC